MTKSPMPRLLARRGKYNRYTIAPLTLISANVVLFGLFFAWPAVIGLMYSFTNYTGVGAYQYIGLANYTHLFGDSSFYASLERTLLYAALVVPLTFVFALLTANLLVSKHAKGKLVARIIFFEIGRASCRERV